MKRVRSSRISDIGIEYYNLEYLRYFMKFRSLVGGVIAGIEESCSYFKSERVFVIR